MDSEESLQMLVQIRLTHMVNQFEHLLSEGNLRDAELVRDEGLLLAEAYDMDDAFLVINTGEFTQ